VRARLNRLRQRWPWFDVTMAVQDRYTELEGSMVASAVTLSIFISLFPALLVGTAVLGFIAQGKVDLAGQIIDKLGLSGNAADTLQDAIGTAARSRKAASIVGLAGLVWSSLGVVQAIQLAVDRAWQVSGGGLIDKVRDLGWLVATGALVVATTAGTALIVSVLPGWAAPLMIVFTIGVNVLMFWCTFALIGHQTVGWRPLLPGAVFAGVALQVLTLAGAIIVPRSVASSSALYGSLGAVFAILAWLYFFGRLLVYASTLNVVLYERERGTVTLEVEAPRMPGEVPVGATRSGVVIESA
jgi:membrane protein